MQFFAAVACHFRLDLAIFALVAARHFRLHLSIFVPVARDFHFDLDVFALISLHIRIDLVIFFGRICYFSRDLVNFEPVALSISLRPCNFCASSSSFLL